MSNHSSARQLIPLQAQHLVHARLAFAPQLAVAAAVAFIGLVVAGILPRIPW